MMAAVMAVAISANAQKKEYPKQEEMKPGMSEYWTPQPKIVTPGDEKTSSAPDDAIVLFDGKDLSAWTNGNGNEEAGWTVKKGIMTVDKSKGDIKTKEKFGSFQLHLEWRVPEGITGESQARGNSGVFLQDMYEVQILDNYQNETYVNGMVGSIYKQTPPMANVMRKPGEWNVFDIIYTAPGGIRSRRERYLTRRQAHNRAVDWYCSLRCTRGKNISDTTDGKSYPATYPQSSTRSYLPFRWR